MEVGQIIAESRMVDTLGYSGGRNARRANPGSITPTTSSEAFGD